MCQVALDEASPTADAGVQRGRVERPITLCGLLIELFDAFRGT